MPPFSITRKVEFRDTDAAGIMHFSVYFNYMEVAEHAFLRSLGLNVILKDEEGEFSFPRVSAHCEYTLPLRFEDEVEVVVHISRVGEKSITFHFQFLRHGHGIAHGQLVTVCVRPKPDGSFQAIPIPEWVATALKST